MSDTKRLMMPVVEIFSSIEGETKRTGRIVTFIRFAGCNLRCKWCDTGYALDVNTANYEVMSIDKICKKVFELDSPLVTITGGEPLIQEHISELVQELVKMGFEINIETNGSMPLDIIAPCEKVYFSVDRKLSGSGQKSKMISNKQLVETLNPFGLDCIKYVVSNVNELNEVKNHIHDINIRCEKIGIMQPTHYISPCYGFNPAIIVDFMKQERLVWNGALLQVQLHKVIWDKDKRGV